MPSRYAFIAQCLQRPGRQRLAVDSLALAAILLIVVNPEARLLLLWLNFIGVDVVLLFLAFALRHYLAIARSYFLASLPLRLISIVFPKFSPSLTLIGVGPRAALCALVLPLTAAATLVWSVTKAIYGRGGGV